MTDKQITFSTEHAPKNDQSAQDQNALDTKRDTLFNRLYTIWTTLSIIAVVAYFWSYASQLAWQLLANAGGVIVALVLVSISRAAYRRNKSAVAEILFSLAVFVIYAATELFWSGQTAYNIFGGLLLFMILAYAIRPKNGEVWLAIATSFIVVVLLTNQLAPLARFDITQTSVLRFFMPVATIIFALFTIWQLVISLQATTTIRNRLLISFILLTLIPVLITSITSVVIGTQYSQQQVISQLNAQAQLKTLRTENWMTDLHESLSNVMRADGTGRDYYRLISSPLSEISEQNAYRNIQSDFQTALQENPDFNMVMVINQRGIVVVSTQLDLEGKDLSNRDYFVFGSNSKYLQPLQASSNTEENFLFMAHPVHANSGIVIGVLVVRIMPNTLNEIIADRTGLGETGESYLIDENLTLLTDTLTDDFTIGESQIDTLGPQTVINSKASGDGSYANHRDEEVIGVFQWLPELSVAFITEQAQDEAFSVIRINLFINLMAALVAIGLAITIALVVTQSISTPIIELAETATQVAAGEVERIEPLERRDEIGELSRALSQMTDQINQHMLNLEDLVAERTQNLETRSRYLEAAADVGRAATQIYKQDELLTTVTHLISERFSFYHVGIFLLDDTNEYAVLKATNSEGGWRMLARGHRLKVNEQGIVGYVTGTHKPRIQQSVGADGVYYNNPDLPLTRSEMALPLISSGELLGALDVQSTQENAFDEADISVLQVLADQVAMAISNSLLFEQLQASLEAERRVYGELSSQAWQEMLSTQRTKLAVRSDEKGVQFVDSKWRSESLEAQQHGRTIQRTHPENGFYPLSVPIKVRGDVIAAIFETKKRAEDGPWTPQELVVIEAVAEQLGIALENARLFEETQRLAQRERVAAEVAGKVWASSDINTILQTAVQELGRALNASQGVIRLKLPDENGNSAAHTIALGDLKND